MNHYSYGVIAGWLVKGICGIQLEHGKLTIAPNPYPLLKFAKVEYNSPVGTIVSEWRYEGEQPIYEFDIPANAKAEVTLPDGRKLELATGHHLI